ncbi:MAG TPA: DUF3108 domain-containing protein [Bacteroidia bacterium]
MMLFFKISKIAICCLAVSIYFFFKDTAPPTSIPQRIETIGLPTKTNTAFKAGEVLSYRLHYGIVEAGVAILEVEPEIKDFGGHKAYHIIGKGFSKGAFNLFFKVDDKFESYIDKDALVPWYFMRRCNEGGFIISQDYLFNHYLKKVDVVGDAKQYDIPEGVQDMLSSFYFARNIDFTGAKENSIYEIPSFVDKQNWTLKIKYVCTEVINTDIGKFRCLKFRPIVQTGNIFKKEEDLSVWVTDDKNHVPLRAQAKILVGSVKMDITSYKNLANATSKIQ